MRETERLLLQTVRIRLVKGRPCAGLLRLWEGYSNVDAGKKLFFFYNNIIPAEMAISFFTALKIPTAKLRDCDTINQAGQTDREF